MAYKSQINLGGLGEVPKTQDAETFADFTDVYNAIHILAQWTNALVERFQHEDEQDTDNGPDKDPWESMTFKDWIWLPARQAINQGDVISSVNYTHQGTTYNGVYKGAHMISDKRTFDGTWNWFTFVGKTNFLVGIALEDAAIGDLVKFGIGPAIMNVGGVKAGDRLYCRPALEHWSNQTPGFRVNADGQLYINPPTIVPSWPSGWPQIGANTQRFETVIGSLTGPPIPGVDPYLVSRGANTYLPVGYGVSDDAVMILGPQMMSDYGVAL